MKTSNSNKNSILLDESKEYEISIKSLENDLCFTIAKNKNITLILRDFKTENNVDFLVENDSIVDVKIINETGNRNFNFSGKIKENSALNIYYADLSNSSINFNSCIDLIENNIYKYEDKTGFSAPWSDGSSKWTYCIWYR
mgnify:CR=1 FL=1